MATREEFFEGCYNLDEYLKGFDTAKYTRIYIQRDNFDTVVQADKFNDGLSIIINMNDWYFKKETEFQALLSALITDQYKEENFPTMEPGKDLSIFTHDKAYWDIGSRLLTRVSGGTGTDRQLSISITADTSKDITSYLMMEKIAEVFGGGVSDQTKKTRDRRHKNIILHKKVPKLVDELKGNQHLPEKIRIYLDVSWSITYGQAMLATAIVKRFEETYPHCEVDLYAFSGSVQKMDGYTWGHIQGCARGGTELKPILKHMEENPSRINVIIGDMDFNEIYDKEVTSKVPENVVLVSVVSGDDVDSLIGHLPVDRELCFVPPSDQ